MGQCLILVCGRPGSGKSALARALAKEFDCVLIDKDCIDDAFSPEDRGRLYDKEIKPKVYQSLINLALPNLELQKHVLLDAPWTHNFLNDPTLTDRVLQLALKTGSKLVVLEIELSPETIRRRLTKRGFKRDQDKLTEEGWAKFLKDHLIGQKNPLPHHVIDGEAPSEACIQRAIALVEEALSFP